MDSPLLVIVVLLVGLVFGASGGWFAGSRPVAEWRARHAARDAEARELDEKFRRAIVELEGASVRAAHAEGLAGELTGVRGEKEALAAELATFKANAANFEEQKRLLVEAREQLLREFQNTGSAVLSKAQEAFLERASERFGHAEKSSEDKIKALLQPVGERLKRYEEQVETLEKQRVDAFGHLTGLIQSMREGQEQVRREAQRLGNSLTNAPKARGRWGEQQLRNVMESCGLAEHVDFLTEVSMNTADGRLRPDAIVRVPGGRNLVIDAKVSLNAYQDAFNAVGDDERNALLGQHAAAIRAHVATLGAKAYQDQFDDAPDYVVMFIPGEHFLAAALEHDPGLWDYAFGRRVLLATPTNLVAIARTVAGVWRQERMADQAREIGQLGKELYARMTTMGAHIGRLGKNLDTAVGAYNQFVGSFESQVLTQARRFEALDVETGVRKLEPLPSVDTAARTQTKLSVVPPLDEAAGE